MSNKVINWEKSLEIKQLPSEFINHKIQKVEIKRDEQLKSTSYGEVFPNRKVKENEQEEPIKPKITRP